MEEESENCQGAKRASRKIETCSNSGKQERVRTVQNQYEFEVEYDLNIDFVTYMDNFIANHQIKEIRKFYAVKRMFMHFTKKNEIACYELTETFLRRFVQYLEQNLKGESASNYFAKLKQIIKAATSDNHFRRNPAENIKVKKTQFLNKEVLNFVEIQTLAGTPLKNGAVKNAFLLSCLTGLRFCERVRSEMGECFLRQD